VQKLLFALAILGVLWVVGELAVVSFAQTKVEEGVAERVDGEASVSADISSFPLATRVLASGVVKKMSVTLDEVRHQRLTFSDITITAEGIEVDRSAILRQEVKILAIDRGEAVARIHAGALPPVARRVIGQSRIAQRLLIIGPLTFQLPREVLPCDPEVTVEGEDLVLRCSFDEVPDALLDAAQAR
jgi:hypothetical protein